MPRIVPDTVGYGRSNAATFTIPSGATGAAVAPVDLGRNYTFLLLRCEDCVGIPASTKLSVQVGEDSADTLCTLGADDGSAWQSANLPTSGSIRFWVAPAAFAQRLRLVLSQNATANVVWTVYGFDGSVT